MTSVIPMKLPMREDVVTDGEIEPAILANAPLDRRRLLRRAQSHRMTRPRRSSARMRWNPT